MGDPTKWVWQKTQGTGAPKRQRLVTSSDRALSFPGSGTDLESSHPAAAAARERRTHT